MQLLMIAVLVISFLISRKLFKKAAGSLRIEEINLISVAYYYILIFCFIGTLIIACGFKGHYLVNKIINDEIIFKTVGIVSYTMIAFPLSVVFFNSVFIGRHVETKLRRIIAEKTEMGGSEVHAFFVAIVICLVGSLTMFYVFRTIGVIPILTVLSSDASAKVLRALASREFAGNVYVRNFLMLTMIPAGSYFAYICMRISTNNKYRWSLLFGYLFFLSIFAEMYDLEKGPLLLYLAYFLVIEILLGNNNIKKYMIVFAVFTVLLIVAQYIILMQFTSNYLSLTSGPVARIFITSIATLFLHVQAFPDVVGYLYGSSLPGVYTAIFGISESWVRSGRLVMEIYNPLGVLEGTAGVMNTLFVGEAYANWGIVGVAIAPVFVGFIFSLAYAWFLNQNKTPYTMVLYMLIFISLTQGIMGGIVGYFYSASLILSIIVFVLFRAFGNDGKIVIRKWNRNR